MGGKNAHIMNHSTPKPPQNPCGMLVSVICNKFTNPVVAITLESVLRRVIPLDWHDQGGACRDVIKLSSLCSTPCAASGMGGAEVKLTIFNRLRWGVIISQAYNLADVKIISSNANRRGKSKP